ncbi:hypothetical protein L2E82_21087 [Cichorium intybus]|uniref:Uncharacterized protein n=1 Tax=Cichorium intybus TaxID=13427 RepID=A0ACB9DV58_CICIN|nr:hypothetical protein L2E82_21087 [Cichorium intybus]
MTVTVGIDLGTTYSCVAVWRHKYNRVEIIPNEQGNRTTPSCVAFSDSERFIGDAAKNQIAMNPVNTIFDAKRFIGRRFSDDIVQADKSLYPFNITGGLNDKPMISVTFKDEAIAYGAAVLGAKLSGDGDDMVEIEKMVKDAEMFRIEDEEHRKKVEAYNDLEKYAYSMKNKVMDPSVVSRLRYADLKTMETAIELAISWLDANDVGDVTVLVEKKKALESVCNPFIAKLYG